MSCSGCYRWLGDAGSCIQVVSSVWVLTIWYSLGLVWRRQYYPTPVLLPGKSHGWRSLVGCSLWFAKSRTRLSDFIFTFHFHALEKEMATHSSVLAQRIPGTGEPGGLPATGSHRGSDLVVAAAAGLVLQLSRVLESVRPLQSFRAWSLSGTKIPQVVCYGIKWD